MQTTSLTLLDGRDPSRRAAGSAGEGLAGSALFRSGRRTGPFRTILDRLMNSAMKKDAPRKADVPRMRGETGEARSGETGPATDGALKGAMKAGEGFAASFRKADRDVSVNDNDDRRKAPAKDTKRLPRDHAPDAVQALPIAAQPAPNQGLKRGAEAGKPESENTETKNTDSRKPSRVDVIDLRVTAEAVKGAAKVSKPGEGGETAGNDRGDPGGQLAQAARQAQSGQGEARSGERLQNAGSSSFSELLSRRLGEQYNVDIVKAAQIVLKDGDSGLIRLRLEPESLGTVKIELKLAEKEITGRIVVETEEARSAFERNMGQLRDAFTGSGFESAKLEVSVSGGNTGDGRDADQGTAPFFSERLRSLDTAVPTAAPVVPGSSGIVNLFA
ncbi:MAG: flagellar hook-length control protein FliK [Spirochaetes bacterium]|nr:flagellar hook-length control protein FliK [Spirochaetota bacterium]